MSSNHEEHPADNSSSSLSNDFDISKVLDAEVTKSSCHRNAGLHLTHYKDGIYVYKVDGLFDMFTPVTAGQKLLKVQDRDVTEYSGGIDEIQQVIDQEDKVSVQVYKSTEDVESMQPQA